MQNLFQTQNNNLAFNNETQKAPSKSEDLFKMLDEQPKQSGVSMSTFSGGQQGGIDSLDLGNFGTMQMGKANNQSLDQGFSFTKKEEEKKPNEDLLLWNWLNMLI